MKSALTITVLAATLFASSIATPLAIRQGDVSDDSENASGVSIIDGVLRGTSGLVGGGLLGGIGGDSSGGEGSVTPPPTGASGSPGLDGTTGPVGATGATGPAASAPGVNAPGGNGNKPQVMQ